MNGFYILAAIAIFVGIPILVRVGTKNVARAVNRNLISKDAYQEEKRLTSEIVHFSSSKKTNEIREKLPYFVITGAPPSFGKNDLYVKENVLGKMVYAYGNKIADQFEAAFYLMKMTMEQKLILW